MTDLANYIDHTNLKPDAAEEDIRRLIEEAKRYGFASVCIHPCWVRFAAERLNGTDVAVCTVIGFPLGAGTAATKAFESRDAVANGADEGDRTHSRCLSIASRMTRFPTHFSSRTFPGLGFACRSVLLEPVPATGIRFTVLFPS